MTDPSREGLLDPQKEKVRQSFYSDSDIDATEFLTNPLDSPPLKSTPAFLPQGGGRRVLSCAPCATKRSCIFFCVLFIALWIVLGAGGAFVYTKYQDEPPYGLSPPWYPSPLGGTAATWAASYAKAAKMVEKMTLAEKVNVTTGVGWRMSPAVGSNAPAVHVGFPQLHFQDGPLGLRFADNASAFPAGITVGATFNKQLMYLRGKALGSEARDKGINVLLGPAIGPLGRIPAGGRNWEGFGADPYLQGVAGAQTIKGIQEEGVMASVKHFVGNEQEHFRQAWEWGLPHAISSNMDDRTLHEIYGWPFQDAVKAGVASVMCSYNMVNASYACQNSKLLNGILKDEMGFQGFVVSDWLAQRSGVASAIAGLDLTLPGDGLGWADGKSLWGPQLTQSILNGSVPVDRLNDMVTRIVAAWYQLGQDNPARFEGGPNFSSWTKERTGVTSPGSSTAQEKVEVNKFVNVQKSHSDIARQVAAEGTVLLKNDNILPISKKGFTDAKRRHEGKLKIAVFGEDAGPAPGGPNSCVDRGCNKGTLAVGWGSGAVDFPYLVTPIEALKAGFEADAVEFSEYLSNANPFIRHKAAADTDVCIVFANADAGEGFIKADGISGDRNDLLLQKGGDELVFQVAKKCGGGGGQVIVVIHSVGPVVMERWIDLPTVKAVILANLPGQESGHALADIIFGDENPSGKLPYTIGKSHDDYPKVMYFPNGVAPQQNFSEGVFVDYRHFDKAGIQPRFEFGYGLSYTTFSLDNLSIRELQPKDGLPKERPAPAAKPPTYSKEMPDEGEALWPTDGSIRRLDKYVYPYLDGVDELVTAPYPYPDGFFSALEHSPAGGDEGGNPDLWEVQLQVSATVRNTGSRDGKVVAQLYVGFPEVPAPNGGVEFPPRQLRGFEKVDVPREGSVDLTFNVTRRDLSFWDVERQTWRILTKDQYIISVGQSSRDLTLEGKW